MKAAICKKSTILLLLIILLLLTIACNTNEWIPENVQDVPKLTNAGKIGEGSTVFLFMLTDDNGDVTFWDVHTDADTVGDALVDAGLIEGEKSSMGLMVSHVNGIRADFMEDSAYWAFYVDGEFAMAGVDSTDIEEGVTYAFVYTAA